MAQAPRPRLWRLRRLRWRFKRFLRKREKRFLTRVARPALNRFLTRYSKVGDPVVFENGQFPWTKDLEAHLDEIRAEVIRLGEIHDVLPTFHEVSPYQKRISKGGGWKTLWLYGFGHDSPIAQELCPVTTRLVKQIPGLRTAFFSMLAPRTHIPSHTGVYKGLLNCHLGIIIPKQTEKCRMQVGDELVVWQAGQSYVFDDTNRHEVWNDTGQERTVLMLQFDRPFRQPGLLVSQLSLWALQFTSYLRKPRQNIVAAEVRLRRAAGERGLLDADT
jgi:beta-hydroxylase